ncbi:heparan-alpha-glucosaminide N-acetyltransferase domain-containing protein [soil metagenome]
MRIRAIDWARGLVMILMTVDHSGTIFDAAHLHGDNYRQWTTGSPLPAGEFLTRWITHLCAPMFLLLAGVSLALSTAKRANEPGQTAFIVKRGLLIASLDPIWMGLGFSGYQRLPFQVLFAIGMSMVCMAFLRTLSTRTLLLTSVAIMVGGELTSHWLPSIEPLTALWRLTFFGGPIGWRFGCAYPFVPWLAIMMFGFVLGRWLLRARPRAQTVRMLATIGCGFLVVFMVVRGADDYGNWHLYRDSVDILQWLHVNKYPPSLSFMALELGIAFVLLAGFMAIDDPERPRRGLTVLGVFGSTAFFYYLLHVHLMQLANLVLRLDPATDGLAKTWIVAALCLAALAAPCWWYLRYKAAHRDSWTRYI